MSNILPIIYQDEHLVVINKPISLPVHKSKGMANDAPYVTKWLGQQLECSVYNVHRLDAKTSGILLLALSPEIATQLTEQFARREVDKVYHALVKGIPGEGVFNGKVKKAKRGNKATAETAYRTLRTVYTKWEHKGEENLPLSLVELKPTTGRWHQLRQHCSHDRHDIIGDAEHGDFPLNRLLAEMIGEKRLYLHACSLSFEHPVTKERMTFEEPTPPTFAALLDLFDGES
ncbi:MAG: RluA family pseudouridine synthase [Lewinella sp.]|uniref:RluA family pseudouridine synthase n=1 Tax=Lewinella sp. TaxID=2004506 RepID=UPI003D6C52BF